MDIWKYFQSSVFSNQGNEGNDDNHNNELSVVNQGQHLIKNRTQIKGIVKGNDELYEGFTSNGGGDDRGDSLQIHMEIQKIEEMHDEFMALIQERAMLEGMYHAGLQEYAKRMTSGIAGRNIRIGETIYYITKYGYSREYGPISSVAWVNRNSRCGGDPIDQDTSLDRLDVLEGPAMKETTICGYEGSNVRFDGKVAYVKMNGEVLLYNNPLKPGDIVSCPKEIQDVDETTWNGLMGDRVGTMSKSTRCMVESLEINTPDGKPVKAEIEALTPKIEAMAKAIQKEMDEKINPRMKELNQLDNAQKRKFHQFVEDMNKNIKQGDEYTLNGMVETTKIMERQQYIRYVFLVVIVLIVLGILYMAFKGLGGVVEKVQDSVRIIRGAPRQSVLRSAARGTSAYGGVGFSE